MKISELRTKSAAELKEIIVSSKKEQFNLRMQAATSAESNKQASKVARKTVARAKTILNEAGKTAKSSAPKKAVAKKTASKKKG